MDHTEEKFGKLKQLCSETQASISIMKVAIESLAARSTQKAQINVR